MATDSTVCHSDEHAGSVRPRGSDCEDESPVRAEAVKQDDHRGADQRFLFHAIPRSLQSHPVLIGMTSVVRLPALLRPPDPGPRPFSYFFVLRSSVPASSKLADQDTTVYDARPAALPG